MDAESILFKNADHQISLSSTQENTLLAVSSNCRILLFTAISQGCCRADDQHSKDTRVRRQAPCLHCTHNQTRSGDTELKTHAINNLPVWHFFLVPESGSAYQTNDTKTKNSMPVKHFLFHGYQPRYRKNIMILGLLAGILAAIIQPFAYLFSRAFISRGGPALELLIYSHLIMGFFSGITLLFYIPTLEMTPLLAMRLSGSVVTFLIGQGCYLLTAKLMEPSRLTTLLGLKIIFLVLLNLIFFNQILAGEHILAVILCTASAFVMNRSGIGMDLKTFTALMLCCLFLAGSDIMDMLLVQEMPFSSVISSGIAATALCYFALALVVLPTLAFIPLDRKKLRAALPYSLAWLLAMAMLFICFGAVGTVFGNIIQSCRTLVQVILGTVVAWMGYAALEGKVSSRQWLSRGLAACMVMTAVSIYTIHPS